PSSLGTVTTRAPRARCASYTYITDGKLRSSYTILLRRPPRSKHDSSRDWQIETFWCITTERGAAPMIRPTLSPTVTGIAHHPSAQARTPRVAHCRVYSSSCAMAPRGIAPSEWLTR